jgi:cysteine desulfurase family protein (TIGR01976 family)
VSEFDVRAVRSHIPALASGVAFFDGPGGTQVPDVVADAIRDALASPISNRGIVTEAERNADAIVAAARAAMADLLGAGSGGVVFGRSMTQLTYDVARTLARTWHPGDEVVVTRLDHDANVRPWVQAAAAAGAVIRWADFDPDTSELTVDDVAAQLSERTRLVALTGASNLIGTRPPLAAIAEAVHGSDALFYVDGVHLTAHAPIDIGAIGADFFVCSPYKFLGPHCGVLAASPRLLEGLSFENLLPQTDVVPERFELGTLPYELMAGTTAAVDFLVSLAPADGGDRRSRAIAAMRAIEAHEDGLRAELEHGLSRLPGVVLHSRARERTPTLLITFEGRAAGDAYAFLAARGVNAPAGSFYALEASRRLGLGDEGGLRIGLAPYTDVEDVERLLAGLIAFLEH